MMKTLPTVSFVFFLLCSFGGVVTALPVAHSETSKGKTLSAKTLKVSQTSLKTPAFACSSDGCVHFAQGKELFERGMYRESVEKFRTAYEELPIVGDYALFFMARAYTKDKEFDKANSCIDELLDAYPDSFLKKRTRALRIKNSVTKSERAGNEAGVHTVKTLEQYVTDYPEDEEMRFLFGKVLKTLGKKEQAKRLFRQVYVTTSSFSDAAYKELEPSDITAEDMLSKASGHLKDAEYKKAESLLRKALVAAGDTLREDILKKLALALFRQKRYREAAAEYTRAGSLYDAARSLYRAGDTEAFSSALEKLVSMEDKRAGPLLLALASKKRREGKVEEALKVYDDVRKAFPSHTEEALWGIAWTCYRAGDFERASKVLTELNSAHPDNRYLYWKARCTNISGGGDVSSAGRLLIPMNDNRKDFYTLLAEMHDRATGKGLSARIPLETDRNKSELCTSGTSAVTDDTPGSGQPSLHAAVGKGPALSRLLERFVILMSLGIREDAIAELIVKSGEFSNPDVLLYLGQVLKKAGAYKNAIALISGLSKNKDTQGRPDANIDDILYPLAFWPIVEDATKSHNLDPFVLLAVMREESRFDPGARSVAGAVGLMQIMPQTAQTLGRQSVRTENDLSEVKTNIDIGAFYLGRLIEEFGSLPAAIAAYNAGEEKVREWLKLGNYRSFDEFIEDIPYDETRNYVKRVLVTYSVYTQRAVQDEYGCSRQVSP